MHKKRTKGITLIEVLFVLGVMAIIIGMVMVLLSMSQDRSRVNALREEILQIKSASASLYGESINQTGYNSKPVDSSKVLINSGMLASKYANGSILVTPYGTKIELYMNSYNGQLIIALFDIPKSACIALSSQDWGDNLSDYRVGNLDVFYPQQISAQEAVNNCTNDNYIAIDYKTI